LLGIEKRVLPEVIFRNRERLLIFFPVFLSTNQPSLIEGFAPPEFKFIFEERRASSDESRHETIVGRARKTRRNRPAILK
jgi:hypothetical protein